MPAGKKKGLVNPMSYCVNCGVELSADLSACPLCNTSVNNPNLNSDEEKPSVFPEHKGQVDVVKHRDLAVFLSIVLGSTAITCALLNLLIFQSSLWSLPIIGICVLLWVFAIPAIIYTKLTLYWSLFFDGIVVAAYLFMLTWLTTSDTWFLSIALPLVILITLLLEIILFLLLHFSISFLTTSLYLVIDIAILCIGIELLVDANAKRPLSLSWSAIVLTVCTIITVALVTVLSRSRLRNEVRRRLHF